MTLGKLIKELQDIQEKFGSRVAVCADTETLRNSCNDVWQFVDIKNVETDRITLVDGDGWSDLRKDGQEKSRFYVILK